MRLSILTFISVFIKITKYSPDLSTKRTSKELRIKYIAYCRAGPKQYQAEHTQKCSLMSLHLVCTFHLTGKKKYPKKKWSRRTRTLSEKLLTGYKAANPKWCEQHVSVKLGHRLPSCILFQNVSETEAWPGWRAVLEQSQRTATHFPLGELTASLGTVSRSIH